MTMTRRKLGSATALAFALGALTVVPATSDAGDHKIFPGSLCRQATTDNVAVAYNYSVSGGALQMEAPGGTASASALDFSCPILRDNEANTSGFKFYTWVNDFWNENEDPDLDKVVCSVGIRKSDGSGQLDWETRSTPTGFTGMMKLDWGTSLATGEAFAVYYMDCFVPTYSGISSYRTDEP
jgi:hypothetical protein